MVDFNIRFKEEEKIILRDLNIIIRNSQRFYLYDENDIIPRYGIPREYKILDFHYVGTSWKSLIFEFGNWFTKQVGIIDNYIELLNQSNQPIFSKDKKTNYVGPLNNGLYINNNIGTRLWGQIVIMMTYLGVKEKGVILVRFPFHRESRAIGKLFWQLETRIFFRYLLSLGYGKKSSIEQVERLKDLCRIFREIKRPSGITSFISNPYIITSDDRQELSNAIYQIKKSKYYNDSYYTTLENLTDFKKEIYYNDENFSKFQIKIEN